MAGSSGGGLGFDGIDLALQGLPAYVVGEIPRRDDGFAETGAAQRDPDPGRGARVAALTAAYHASVAESEVVTGDEVVTAGPAVAFGWVRLAAGGPVRVIAAGDTLVGSAGPGSAGEVRLSLPAGARARQLADGELDQLVRGIACWRMVAGISDGLLTTGDRDESGGGRGERRSPGGLSLDDGLLGSWTGAFGWLVAAEPVGAQELRGLAEEVGARQRMAEAAADRFPEQDAQGRRLKERYAEFQRGGTSGFWRVTVAAGGADAATAARIAGLLCAATDLSGLPYALSPAWTRKPPAADSSRPAPPTPGSPAGAPGPGGDGLPAVPFYASTELLAALARPPEAEVPGVRFALRPEFDVTPETPAGADGDRDAGLPLGEVLDRNLMPAGPFAVSAGSLNRHVFVCGATGGGKSQTVRCLLEAATARGIPWLVVEPAKAEYRLMASRLPGTAVIRIRPGEPDAIAAGLNPLEPAADSAGRRFPLQTHADLVKALFIASFQAEEPFPQVLSAALGRVYEEAGWDLALGEPRRSAPEGGAAEAVYPTLTGLQRAAERVVAEIGYSQRVTDDVLGFIRVRLASLRHGTTGRFLEGGHPLDFGALLRSNVVLEIEDVGDDADKAFLMGAVLIRLAEYLRLAYRAGTPPEGRVRPGGLAHLTVVEEAHRLLRRPEADGAGGPGAAAHAVELFAGLLAEIRAYGEGLVIAEQIPAKLVPDAIKNTAVKITHRLPAADDREAVGATMNATPAQSRYLATLPPGRAAVFTDGMDFPVLVQIKDGTEREAAATGTTIDSRGVVHPRSGSCGDQCQARPCTLRDMRGGQRLLEDVPWLRVWAELAVLAHLTGWPVPVPVPDALASLRTRPPRLAQCALSHAVDAAVAVRPGISRPGALARHVAEAARARAERGQWWCRPDEPEWLLPGEATAETVYGAVRPAVLEAGEVADSLAGVFIDCRWPSAYLNRAGA
jgi:DNA helicase HerA-like ATPase